MKPKCFFRGCDDIKRKPASQKETSPLAHFVRNSLPHKSFRFCSLMLLWKPRSENHALKTKIWKQNMSLRHNLSFTKRQYTTTRNQNAPITNKFDKPYRLIKFLISLNFRKDLYSSLRSHNYFCCHCYLSS